ncbi:MAG: hypothetical protein AAF690_04485 [Acidobacteriota bacterium]
MELLIREILLCLLVAALLGGIIGWWLKRFFAENELRREIGSWRSRLDGAEQEALAAQGRLSEARSRTKALENDLASRDDEIAAARTTQRDAQREWEATLVARDEELEQSKSELRDLEAEWSSRLDDKGEELERARAELSTRTNERDGEIRRLQSAAKEARVEVSTIRQALSARETELAELTGTMKDSEASWNDRLAGLQALVSAGEGRLSAREGKLGQRIEELEARLAATQADVEEAKQSAQDRAASLTELEGRVGDAESAKASSEAKLGELQAALATARGELDQSHRDGESARGSLEARVAELEAALSSKERQLLASQGEAKAAVSKLESAESQWTAKLGALAASSSAAGETQAELDRQRSAAENARAQLDEARSDLEDCKSKRQELESTWGTRYADLEREIEALRPLSKTVEARDLTIRELEARIADLESASAEQQYQEKGTRDDLKKIYGIGQVLEKFLNDRGVYWFHQLARWTSADVHRIEEELPEFQGRIERDDWIGGAREEYFKKYGERI